MFSSLFYFFYSYGPVLVIPFCLHQYLSYTHFYLMKYKYFAFPLKIDDGNIFSLFLFYLLYLFWANNL